jgi:undecaprenyl diphosphate synthase
MPTATALDPREVLGAPPEALPRHVAIIMDGNGRWATQRGLPRVEGHRAGATAVRDTITHAARLGIECLTLYSFSHENWKRPKDEVDALMALAAYHLVAERPEIMENGIRFRQIGRRSGLPADVQRELSITEEMSRHNRGLTLCLALNYGARAEIIDAVRELARRVHERELLPEAIDENLFSSFLQTAGLPDPDLVVRTAGEMRLSNFLLWQISYAELYVTPVLWPDFRAADLCEALRSFVRRERRYGDVEIQRGPTSTDAKP